MVDPIQSYKMITYLRNKRKSILQYRYINTCNIKDCSLRSNFPVLRSIIKYGQYVYEYVQIPNSLYKDDGAIQVLSNHYNRTKLVLGDIRKIGKNNPSFNHNDCDGDSYMAFGNLEDIKRLTKPIPIQGYRKERMHPCH